MTTETNTPDADELCPYCGDGTFRSVRKRVPFSEGRVSGEYWDELTQCEKCGREWYTYDQSLANSAAHAAAIAKAQGSPTPDRIRAIRAALDFTQGEMEDAMDIGPKTYIRWEKGYVAPSRAAASLLWIAENRQDAFRDLAYYRKTQAANDEAVIGTIWYSEAQPDFTLTLIKPAKDADSKKFLVSAGGER